MIDMAVDWHPEKFNEKLHAKIVQILTACALIVLADAIRNCPVETGRLRSSLTYEVDDQNLRARVGTNVLYALFVFLGTYKMAARPVLTQSLERNKSEIRRRFRAV
jgi:HK97 gp10 family phage protein